MSLRVRQWSHWHADCASNQAPLLGEEPHAEKDQDERPKTIQTELKDPGSVQKEEHAQADENGGSSGNLGAFEFFAGAKGGRQTERIGSRFAHLDCLGAAHCVDDLVDVEKSDEDSEYCDHIPGKIGTHAEDQQHHDDQVRQSFGVLAGVNGADADGKESGENSSDGGIRASVQRRPRPPEEADPKGW